jgi:hypothetical protein
VTKKFHALQNNFSAMKNSGGDAAALPGQQKRPA